MSTAKLMKAQTWSGLCFSVFLALHLVNTASALAGDGVYDAFQHRARGFYQYP